MDGTTVEADGTMGPGGSISVTVCVFTSNTELSSDEESLIGYGATIQVGQTTLINITDSNGSAPGDMYAPQSSLVQSVASKTSGQIYS